MAPTSSGVDIRPGLYKATRSGSTCDLDDYERRHPHKGLLAGFASIALGPA